MAKNYLAAWQDRVLIMRHVVCTLLLWAALIAVLPSQVLAQPLSPPSAPVILSVVGNVQTKNTSHGADFDLAMLRAFSQHTISTHTPWTNEKTTFEGPLLRDVLTAVGAHGQTLEVVALNDYKTRIPFSDPQSLDIILAFKVNGEVLSVRDKGPLWVIYPWDTHPELRDERIYSRSIWQLKSIKVK